MGSTVSSVCLCLLSNQSMGEWKYGLFDCINPLNLKCLYSVYCHPCAIHDMAEEYEPGTGMFNLVLGLLLPIYPLVTLRGKAKKKPDRGFAAWGLLHHVLLRLLRHHT